MTGRPTGYRWYHLEGTTLRTTPWVTPYIDTDSHALMAAELLASGAMHATLSAERQHGPFLAAVEGHRGRGATPLLALRAAIDARRRAAA